MSYISHEDYKDLMGKFQRQTPKGILKESVKEGNAFTAALAKAKKGEKVKVDGKEITDTSDYDDPSVKEYGYADQPPAGTPHHAQYPESWSVREGSDEELIDLLSRYTKDNPEELAGLNPQAWPDHVAVNMARDKDYQAYLSKHHNSDEDETDYFEFMSDEDDQYPEDRGNISDFNDGEFWEGLNSAPMQATGPTISTKEGLNPAPMQATGQSIDEDHMDKPFKLPKRTDTSRLDYDPDASRFEPDYMKASGEDDDDEDDIISATDDFDDMDIDNDLPMHFKKAVARDKTRYPFLRENAVSNPPYGFDVLSPDERKQLKEYIESVKTIKKEIAKLAAKAGKKIKTEGGDTTGLMMTPSVTSEVASHEKIEKIESKISEKLYSAAEKVIEHLNKAGLSTGEIKMFLNHEVEEMAKKAIEAQHDIAERSYKVSKNAVPVHTLKKGDIITSGEEIVSISAGARTPSGKVDVVLKNPVTGKERGAQWGKHTMIGKKPKSE